MRAFIFGALMTLAGAVSAVAPVRAEDCMADWGVAGEIVRREKLMTVQQLAQSGAAGAAGQIVKTTLCKDGDDYVYKVVARQANGQLKTIVVDARNLASGAAGANSNSR
jgi:uncharacterized membrane protein YkoI